MNKDEKLYNLLPSVYRIRDAAEGEPLRALLAVIEREMEQLEEDIASLYNNWFIETCEEWVVPYIADLLRVRGVQPILSGSFSLRPYVANTLTYRRRKGTATVIEQLARDVTGWNARAVELFSLLSITSHLNHVMPERGTLDLRNSEGLELLSSPFESAAHTCEVRRISSNRGRYNIPNIGIFLWRQSSYPIKRGTAHAVSEPADGRYTFNPLGIDTPLLNIPRAETEITHLAEEINVPGVLRRQPLYNELEAIRLAIIEKLGVELEKNPHLPPEEQKKIKEEIDEEIRRKACRYFDDPPVFEIFINYQPDPIPPEQILICDLSNLPSPTMGWNRPPNAKKYIHINPNGTEAERLLQIQVAVDPVLGRLAFPVGAEPDKVEVSYAYGFSNDVGGGPYNRQNSVAKWYDALDQSQPVTWQIGVTKNPDALKESPEQLVQTLQAAIMAWSIHTAGNPDAFGIISIMDSSTYVEDLDIDIPTGRKLAIIAADWPIADVSWLPGLKQRIKGQLLPENRRPHLKGDISSKSNGFPSSGKLILDGLLIEGKLTITHGNLEELRITHCTLVPQRGGIVVEMQDTQDRKNEQLKLIVDHSICGAITLPETVPELHIMDSIIDHAEDAAITALGSNVEILRSTVLGSCTMRSLEASNSVFTEIIDVKRQQDGCMRFTYVPLGSRTPSCYRCQPHLAMKEKLDVELKKNPHLTPEGQKKIKEEIEEETRLWLKPRFTDMRYGNPGYAQLHLQCPSEISQGADDGAEMGVFHDLYQPQRENNLRSRLSEYLRFGLEAGIFYVD